MVTSNHATALIIAKPSSLQVGLRALLIAMPQVGVVHEADDLSAALQMELEPQPALVLLDGDVSGEIGLAMRRARLRWPQARFVFLANDVQQEKRAFDARTDAVLLKGSPPARLVVVLVSLLGQPEQHEEGSTVRRAALLVCLSGRAVGGCCVLSNSKRRCAVRVSGPINAAAPIFLIKQ